MLEAYKKAFSDEIKVFQLQKRVVGVEVAVGAFFNGKSFVYPININFEHKKLFPGNSGPPTGEMGTTMFWSEPNKIFEQTLLKMEPRLAEEDYVGYIDVNCIVNSNGIYPLEFTSRFGYPTIFIQQEGMITPIGLFLYDLAHGRDPKLKVKSGFQVGVRIVMPPFPFDDDATFESFTKNAVIVFKKGTPGRGPHRGHQDRRGPVARRGHVRRRAHGRRPRPDDEAGPRAGLHARAEHPHPQHVLPRRHRRALGRGLGQAAQLGIPAVVRDVRAPPRRGAEKPDQEQRESFRERRHGNGSLEVAQDYQVLRW